VSAWLVSCYAHVFVLSKLLTYVNKYGYIVSCEFVYFLFLDYMFGNFVNNNNVCRNTQLSKSE